MCLRTGASVFRAVKRTSSPLKILLISAEAASAAAEPQDPERLRETDKRSSE